jgi:predicted ATPase/class 3 adenylate cyclase
MDEIGRWLKALGLTEYVELFVKNDIDVSVLRDLGDADLRELGISLGHRRRLLRAIAELDKTPSSPHVSGPLHHDLAERRQLTVMFCDLAGSTALSTRLDPEDMREVIRAYQEVCSAVIRSYDAFLAKFMGDGILVYFGYPRAREDSAECAVRAGLDIVAAVEGLKTRVGISPKVRIGIATGPVVVGDLVGAGAAQERAVVGEAPNLAARLQGLAEPGTVVIAASTRRLLGTLFELRDLGAHEMKGFVDRVPAWAVERAVTVNSRFEATRSVGLTGFVGREKEIALALDRAQLAWRGEGQVLLIAGEAGVGKSRLAALLAEHLGPDVPMRLRYQCSAYHSNSALYPFVEQLKSAAGLHPADPPATQLDKLETVIAAATPQVGAVAPLFASLLSIPTAERYPPLGVSAAQQRRLTLAAFVDQLEGLAERQRVLCLFEDVHWADATSCELLELAIERVRKLPALVIVTVRPEFRLSWRERSNVTALTLARLDQQHAREMVELLTGDRKLPPKIIERIIEKTDGIPLFIEEFTKSVLESRRDDAGPLESGPALAIPSTLQDSLMARLDRSDAIRHVAQVGAAIGRRFSHSMIAAVTEGDGVNVDAALEKLLQAELIHQYGTGSEAKYAFKHALVQEAAYESLLRSKRQVLHERIVHAIESRFPELIETECEVLARHCERARQTQKAVGYWLVAARGSLGRSHLAETITQLGAAMKVLSKEPETVERDRLELGCQSMLAQALTAAKGYGAPETMDAWQRARTLAVAVGNSEQRFVTNYGLWVGQYAQNQLSATLSLAEACLDAAHAEGDRTQLCVGERMSGIARFVTGDFTRAQAHCARAAEYYDEALHVKLANQLAHDLLVAALCFKGLALWPLGHPDRARDAIMAALSHAKRIAHPPSLAYAYWHAGMMGALMLRDDVLLAEHADAVIALSSKYGFSLWEVGGHAIHGWFQARRGGDATVALGKISTALHTLRSIGARANETVFLALLGEAQAAAGDASAGLRSIGEGIAFAESSQQLFWLAELHRLDAAIRLKSAGDRTGAETALRKAVAVARRQKALSWELRATIDLSSLLADGGDADEARRMLRDVYAGFTEGLDTPDLRTARALMVDLGQQDDAPRECVPSILAR